MPALLDFWALFARKRAEVAGGTGLSSRPVPLLFANGVWNPEPERLAEAAAWCRRQGVPPAVLFAGTDLPAGLEAERVLTASPLTGAATDGVYLEQIGPLQIRPLAELFAYRYDRMDIEIELAIALTAVLEREQRLEAFLAYHESDGEPAGAALAYTPADPERNPAVLVWAESLGGAPVAAAVASRSPRLQSYRLEAAGAPGEYTGDHDSKIVRAALRD